MKKLIKIEEIGIGKLWFTAYVLEDEYQVPCFAIFIDQEEVPLILFQPKPQSTEINLIVDQGTFDYLNKNKTTDKLLRRQYYKDFFLFMKRSEGKAKQTFFKEKKMIYLKDIDIIKEIKDRYITQVD